MSKLTEHQKEVFEKIILEIKSNLFSFTKVEKIEDRLISLTGAAGTGKSYLTAAIVKEILQKLKEEKNFNNEGVYLTAPTHKAVKVLKEMLTEQKIKAETRTIHSFLNIKPIYDYDTGEEKFIVLRNRKSEQRASLLIVDESSMISTQLYKFIIDAVNMGRVNTVLFIGDKNQLLPVNSGDNNVFKLKNQYKLTQIVRQAENSNIIKLATAIRKCIEEQKFINIKNLLNTYQSSEDIQIFDEKVSFLKNFYKNQDWYKEEKVISSYTNAQVDYFNFELRAQFWKEKGILDPDYLQSQDMLRFKSPLSIEGLSISENKILFQNGEEVMVRSVEFIKDRASRLEFWRCTAVDRKDREFFRVIDPNSELRLNRLLQRYVDLAKNAKSPYHKGYWKRYFKLKNSFADVQYVYASTIHKLQGSTYDTAYIDLASLINNKNLSSDLVFRLAYVAVTRARNCVKILL